MSSDILEIKKQLEEIRSRAQRKDRVIAVLSLVIGVLSIAIAVAIPVVGSSLQETKKLAVIGAKSAQAASLQSIGKHREAEIQWLEVVDSAEDAGHFDLASRALHSAGYLAQNLGFIDRALGYYTRSISLTPIWAEAYNVRASLYGTKKNYNGAIEDLDQALLLSPGDRYLLSNRGSMKLRADNCEGAIADLVKALHLFGSDDLEAKRELEQAQDKCQGR